MSAPLIYTTLGNVPVASLTHEVEWQVTPQLIVFTERYRTADGTVVRQDAHVYTAGIEQKAAANL